MARDLNFGVVGLGMGVHHCKAIVNAKGAALAAVCDIDEERLKSTVEKFGCKGYHRYSDLLKDKEIDCVAVVVESGRHADFGIAAAKAGKHLIMEKPVDITPARIKKLQGVVKKSGIKAGCIFQYRMDPCNILLKKAITQKKIGRLIGLHAALPWFRADSYYAGEHGTWRGTWKLDGGGSLMNQGIHTVDLMQWLGGPVRSVCGFFGVFNHKIQAEDQTVAILKFENGALGTLMTTTCCIPGKDQRVYAYGTKGSFSRYGGELESYEAGSEDERKKMLGWFGARKTGEQTSSDPMAVAADGHQLIIEDLVKAVRGNREPVIPIESAKHAVEIACAIFKSGRMGREVKVREMRA
ncbi:MAG: Gfo/Idh/MocA family oxidoreductase [Candidatus Hydrogenedentes bacterium]|nr:Gfo/Idh/MocA family oxidoreductase [Candidatus Hydrogenedentota bacterium]